MSKADRTFNAQAVCEFDQKVMLAMELINELAEQTGDDASETLREIIDHFATSDKLAISLIGVLAQVGFVSIVLEGYK